MKEMKLFRGVVSVDIATQVSLIHIVDAIFNAPQASLAIKAGHWMKGG